MDDSKYFKDGVARVLELMKDTFGDDFRAYFSGQPAEIPESSLPCIMVSEAEGTVETGATGTDIITESILIVVAFNKKDDIGANGEVLDDLTETKLRRIIKGQKPSASGSFPEYLEKTVMYALRKHITLGQTVVGNAISTDFSINLRGDNLATQEAYVTLTIQRHAGIPVRD